MKVLQVGKFFPPQVGGMETFLYDLANILNENGITTDVLCSNITSETKIENVKNYKVVKAGSLGVVASTSISPSLIKCFKEISHDYDIVHIHHPNPTANIALMLSGFKGKVVLHWHSDIIRQKFLFKFYKPFLLWMLRRSDKIIATSLPYAEHSNFLKDFKKKVEIIPFGLNTEKMGDIDKDLVAKIKKSYSGKKIIFSLGRLTYYKGFDYLIKSAKYMPDNYIVLIGGEGKLKSKLELMINRNKLTKKVFLLGNISSSKVYSYFEASDLFVLPSIERSEAFGIVQIEAMYFKKPIVSTNIIGSGVPWVNENGITGYVVEPKNPEKLSEAIIKILINKSIYNNFSVNAYKRFIDNFRIDMTLKRMLRVYNELIK
jgi:rhamnosyl/mannosyltransferase